MGISAQQALDCFASHDLIGIGMEADAVRESLHPEGVVTYAIDGCLETTNDRDAFDSKVEDAVAEGATGINILGCAGRSLVEVEGVLRLLKAGFPNLQLDAFSADEVQALARASGVRLGDVLGRLAAAGLRMLTGDGAEMLNGAAWLDVHRAAHQAGIMSTASMTFGGGESSADRVEFLQAVHGLQQETHGFQAFSVSSAHAPTGRDLDDPTAVEYLKTLAICRMMLDNIPHLQSNWQQQGLKILEMGLRFGANDVGSILGPGAHAPEEEVRRIIRDAGFKPVQRDTLYRFHFLN